MGYNVKKTKKSRVSWPSDSMLCQVKMFQTEDCPAKVGGTQSKASNLPPGYDGTQYSTRRTISLIPRIRWKRAPKFIVNEDLLVASGGESTEIRSENLRIAKVLEAFYPHRSLIPTRPSISPSVQAESYDDSKTPDISLTPIEGEDEPEAIASQSSNASASVFGLGPDLSLAASSALSALIKTKEQGSLIDAALLVKFLSDPKIVKSLLDDTGAAKPLATGSNTTEPPPQHVNSSTMDRNSPPEPTTAPPGTGVPHIVPVLAAQSIAAHGTTQPPVSSAPSVFHAYPVSSLKPSPVDDLLVSEPQCQSLNIPTSSNWNMTRVLESARTGTGAPIPNGAYPMNVTRDDYFKNLIREHGGVTPPTNGTNNYKGRVDDNDNNNNNMKAVKAKFQKPCMFFGRPRGCKLGGSCLYLHDSSKRLWTDVAAPEFPRAKRLKFRT